MGGESRPWEGTQEARKQSGHSELWGGSGQGGFARGLWFLSLSWSSGCWGRSRENPGLEPLAPCNAELATGAPPHSERFLSLALPEEMRVGEKRGLEGQEGLGEVFWEDPWGVWPSSVLAGLTAPWLWLLSVSEHYCACAEP